MSTFLRADDNLLMEEINRAKTRVVFITARLVLVKLAAEGIDLVEKGIAE